VAEEFFADPAAAYRGVLDFLGLPMPAQPPQFKAFNARPAGGMRAETRERLAARFAEPNARLEELLGRSLSWTSPNGAPHG